MIKTAPSFARIASMVLFALSCFGLLLFLWISFGGPVPLKPKGYRFQVAFKEATQLAVEADVRIAGVSVGKVRKLELDPAGNRSLATVELESEVAPIPANARAILRQKTLLGETYVELTPGTRGRASRLLREGERLANAQVEDTVELDEILGALDERTRQAFQVWQQEAADGVRGRGADLNDALGTLPEFLGDGRQLLEQLERQRAAVRRLVRNTGIVFGALTEREDQLRSLVTNTHEVFETTASKNERIAESIRILPTFLDESRATLARLRTFAPRARPVVQLLRQPTRDLGPTVEDLGALAPDLRSFFVATDALNRASTTGLPALSETLRGLRPFFGALAPFLSEINPILKWAEFNQYYISDFFTLGSGALADTVPTANPDANGHYLRQFSPRGTESAAIYRQRLSTSRGNAYFTGTDDVASQRVADTAIFANFDCRPSGGEVDRKERQPGRRAACWETTDKRFEQLSGKFPRIVKP